VSAKANQKIYDKDNNLVREAISSTEYVKPKEIRSLVSVIPLTGLSLGDYSVFTAVSYTTDSAYKNSTLEITQETFKVPSKQEDFTIWIIIFSVAIIAVAIYRWVK
jgi:hypothetical protein